MKLYTEEQLLKALWATEHPFSDGKNVDKIIKSLTPIELPSDEEIIDNAPDDTLPLVEFIAGAKWMRDKIQGGNK